MNLFILASSGFLKEDCPTIVIVAHDFLPGEDAQEILGYTCHTKPDDIEEMIQSSLEERSWAVEQCQHPMAYGL